MSLTEKSSFSVADPGEGPGGPTPPLLLDQTEARRVQKKNFGDCPPLSQDLDDPPPPPVSQGLHLHPALFLTDSPGPGCSNVGYCYPPDKSLPSGKVLGKPVELSSG